MLQINKFHIQHFSFECKNSSFQSEILLHSCNRYLCLAGCSILLPPEYLFLSLQYLLNRYLPSINERRNREAIWKHEIYPSFFTPNKIEFGHFLDVPLPFVYLHLVGTEVSGDLVWLCLLLEQCAEQALLLLLSEWQALSTGVSLLRVMEENQLLLMHPEIK